MIEVAVGYLSAYLLRKAVGLGKRVGSDVDEFVDTKLDELYGWVKARFTGKQTSKISLDLLEQTPEGEEQQALVSDQLGELVASDQEAAGQLQAIVDELESRRPQGVTIRGFAGAEDVHGEQVGVEYEGAPPPGAVLEGKAHATIVHPGAKNIGTRVKGPRVKDP
jgi:hypothetical protein